MARFLVNDSDNGRDASVERVTVEGNGPGWWSRSRVTVMVLGDSRDGDGKGREEWRDANNSACVFFVIRA